MKQASTSFVILGIVIALVLIAIWGSKKIGENKDNPYTQFAQCIESSGAKFYGTYWCPNCANQKALFNGGQKSLPYIECGKLGSRAFNQVCTELGITAVPTWIFADGTRLVGTQQLDTLATKTQCPLPAE